MPLLLMDKLQNHSWHCWAPAQGWEASITSGTLQNRLWYLLSTAALRVPPAQSTRPAWKQSRDLQTCFQCCSRVLQTCILIKMTSLVSLSRWEPEGCSMVAGRDGSHAEAVSWSISHPVLRAAADLQRAVVLSQV